VLPDPLHPAIVHFPIALAVLLPLLTICGVVAIRMKLLPTRAWASVVLLSLVLVLTSWMALETGEEDEERVERVVAEQIIEEHEEAAETFMVIGAILFFASLAGLMDNQLGGISRSASALLALGVLGMGLQVGHLGGALVYEHGAAQAYTQGSPTGAMTGEHGNGEDHEEDDDD
jgi:uncharacterized membrane protein